MVDLVELCDLCMRRLLLTALHTSSQKGKCTVENKKKSKKEEDRDSSKTDHSNHLLRLGI
jgi:hypothetical protein